jgi:hypothetical protein
LWGLRGVSNVGPVAGELSSWQDSSGSISHCVQHTQAVSCVVQSAYITDPLTLLVLVDRSRVHSLAVT